MSALQPMAVYALRVDPTEDLVAALPNVGANLPMFRITMAAIDPSEDPDSVELDPSTMTQRSTLKMIRLPSDLFDDDDDDDDDEYEDDEDDEDEDEDDDEDDEVNGGPSDLKKAKKAKLNALLEALQADEDEDEDEDGEEGDEEADEAQALAALAALTKKGKGKGKEKAVDGEVDDEDDDDDDDSDDIDLDSDEGLGFDASEMALCTLDTRSQYQQPLDLTIGQGEQVYFRVVGSHPVYLTGNYVIPNELAAASEYDDDDDDDEYDLTPDGDELDGLDALVDGESESDELDDLDDPRVTELDGDDDDEAPQLTKVSASAKPKQEAQAAGKGKNKRPAADESDDDEAEPALDDIVAKSLKKEEATTAAATNGKTGDAVAAGETKKLSKAEKRKLKKLKKNDGTAAEASSSAPEPVKAKDAPASNGTAATEKKVQFDKDLVKGPTPNGESKAAATRANKSISVRDVNGVTVDDRKIGNGPTAKKGSKLEMRYIGKLESTSAVFDSNKSGKPFSFKLGAGEVIKGWDIGLEGIKPGGERRIIVPAHLAYGKKSMPGIPANSKLIFDVKCLAVK